MKVSVYKTDKVLPGSHDLFALLDASLPSLPDRSIVSVAAKIVSLCEGRVVSMDKAEKDDLIRQESQQYLPRNLSKYDVSFTITHHMLIPTAGIDESNGNGDYILWPKDLQASANAIREHLLEKHGLRHVGVIITDSTTRPLQWGTTGIAIAYSGFSPLKNYIGQEDIFGRKLEYQKASIANGLAAAAVTLMGEGNEQTPLALLEDLPFVDFQDSNPTQQELQALNIEPQDDLYWPLIRSAPWVKGESSK
jgi:putative folate metabolism gamma-glutamate ligase